jgi:hypothetical protein
MAPGEVGDEFIIANGVGQAPDAFVRAVSLRCVVAVFSV